jgi:hypothetical protein
MFAPLYFKLNNSLPKKNKLNKNPVKLVIQKKKKAIISVNFAFVKYGNFIGIDVLLIMKNIYLIAIVPFIINFLQNVKNNEI